MCGLPCGAQVLDRAVLAFAKAVLAVPALASQMKEKYIENGHDIAGAITPEMLTPALTSNNISSVEMDADTASRVLSSVPNLEIEVGGGTLTVRGETLFAQTTGETTALP